MENPQRNLEGDNTVPTIEEWTLTTLGYSHCLDKIILTKSVTEPVRGRNFLTAYGTSSHRQNTEDLLEAFRHMEPTELDYAATKSYILRFLEAQFGPPIPDMKAAP